MKSQLLDKRIPTILGIGLVLIGIVLTTVIVDNQTSLRSSASNSQDPQNIKLTNLSDNSFTVTYQTDAAAIGSINYGESKELGNTELDDLDKEKGNFSPKNIHSITVKKLSPNTKYRFVIISGQNTFLNNGSPFEIVTAPSIVASPSSQSIIQGKVVLPDGKAPDEAIIYLSTENSQLLSSIAKDGKFTFSLESLRSSNLSSYLTLSKNSVLKLLAMDKSLKSNVLVSFPQTNSIPTITLSNDYDFTHADDPVASKSAEFFGFPQIPSPTPTKIITPIPTPTPTQTPTSTPTPAPQPSPAFIPVSSGGSIEPPGNSSTILILGGIITTVIGITLLVLTHAIL